MREIVGTKPTRCPVCGADRIAPILYGLPAFDEQLDADLKAGRIVLGGCCVSDDMPEWHCGACAHEWAMARGNPMIDEIKRTVHEAAGARQKIAMFHLEVLRNAEALEGMDPEATCRELGVPVTYATEFRKMLNLARLMKERGMRLVEPA